MFYTQGFLSPQQQYMASHLSAPVLPAHTPCTPYTSAYTPYAVNSCHNHFNSCHNYYDAYQNHNPCDGLGFLY